MRAIRVQYHYNTSNCERSMKLGTNVYQHILNFFWESHAHMSRDCWCQHFLGKFFFLQNPKHYIPLERYFVLILKKVYFISKKIIQSKVIAILRSNDNVIKNFWKTLLLMIKIYIYHWKDILFRILKKVYFI